MPGYLAKNFILWFLYRPNVWHPEFGNPQLYCPPSSPAGIDGRQPLGPGRQQWVGLGRDAQLPGASTLGRRPPWHSAPGPVPARTLWLWTWVLGRDRKRRRTSASGSRQQVFSHWDVIFLDINILWVSFANYFFNLWKISFATIHRPPEPNFTMRSNARRGGE